MTMPDLIDSITAGTTLDFETTVPDYPAGSGWTLDYYLRGPSSIHLQATVDGSSYHIQADAATTGTWLPGMYAWEARVTNGSGVVYPVATGRLTILADLTKQVAGYDPRTPSEQAIAAIDAEILARAQGGGFITEYTIGSRHLKKETTEQLRALRTQLASQIARERRAEAIANGLGDPTKMFVRLR